MQMMRGQDDQNLVSLLFWHRSRPAAGETRPDLSQLIILLSVVRRCPLLSLAHARTADPEGEGGAI